MREDSAPIGIADTDFAVDLKIMAAPKGLMLRELLINGAEAPIASGESKRHIRFYLDDSGKLAIINSGVGMSGDMLRKITDLNFSTKKMGLEGRDNRGEGAKASSLKFNRLGMRYRSRDVTGEVSEVTIFHDGDRWARKREWVGDDEDGAYEESVEVFLDGTDSYVTQQEIDRYASINGQFTEVLLMGNMFDQNTAVDPYGESITGPKQRVANLLFSRFYTLPKVTGENGEEIPLVVEFDGDSFRAGAKFRTLIPTGDLPEKYPNYFEHLEDRFRSLPSGVVIEYLCSTIDDKSRNVYNQCSVGLDSCRAGLVWNSEIYDLHEAGTWQAAVTGYGMYSLARRISVFVHLPIDYCSPDGYRERVLRDDAPIALSDFRDEIFANRPDWLRKMIEQPKDAGAKNVEDELKKIAAKIFDSKRGVNKPKIMPKTTGPKFKVIMGGNLGGGGGGTSTGGGNARGPNTDDPQARGGPGGVLGRRRRQSMSEGTGPGGLAKGVPRIYWVSGDELAHLPQLTGRGAFYSDTAEPTLYLNRDYAMFDDIINDLFTLYFKPNDIDLIGDIVSEVIKRHVSIKVCTGVLLMLHKRGTDHWAISEVNKALTPEALTMTFDICGESTDVGLIASKITRSTAFKLVMAGASITEEENNEALSATA